MRNYKRLLIRAAVIAAAALTIVGCAKKPDAAGTETAAVAAVASAETEAGADSTENAAANAGVQAEKKEIKGDVTIIYTNDIHAYIDNKEDIKDADGKATGETRTLLTYGKVAALREDLETAGKNVLLLDAGDHVQGTVYGGMDEGATVMKLMEACKYDLATLGNHEFDYGMFRIMQIIDLGAFPYVSCNFTSLETNENVLPAYKVFERGGMKIAVIGITTPESLTKSTPAYFQDEKGNYIYDITVGADGKKLYAAVQKAIDDARKEADLVIALAHLGVDEASAPYRATDVIANTHGLDALIDGHSHTQIERMEVEDQAGQKVIYTQTGSYLNAIGLMHIHDGEITTELLKEYDRSAANVDAIAAEWIQKVEGELGVTIAHADTRFAAYEVEGDLNTRMVRLMETNLGDFAADAVYYYFNEVEKLDCDLALVNGGGLRNDIAEGDVSYKSVKNVEPFGNVICMVEVTGRDILNAFEWGVRAVGQEDDQGRKLQVGAFPHIAGARFKVHKDLKSTVQVDDKKVYVGEPTGEYKVFDVEIYNRETKSYEPLDLDRSYTLAGINYTLRNNGDGYAMLKDSKLVKDYVGQDYLITAEYLKAFATGAAEGDRAASATGKDGNRAKTEAGDGGNQAGNELPHLSTANSPLNCDAYAGYMINYEDIHGAGRVVIE